MANVTFTLETSGNFDDVATSFTTASVPFVDDTVYLAVFAGGDITDPGPAATIAGGNLVWVEQHTEPDNQSPHLTRMWLWTGRKAVGATTGAVTFSGFTGNTLNGAVWGIVRLEHTLGGAGGDDAIVQTAGASASGVTSLTVTLAAFSDVDNATFGAFVTNSLLDMVPGAGYTQITEVSSTAPDKVLMLQRRGGNDTSVDASVSVNHRWVGIAAEIAFAELTGAATLTGAGALSATGRRGRVGAATLTGSSTLSATGTGGAGPPTTGPITRTSKLATANSRLGAGVVLAIGATGPVGVTGEATLSGAGALSATAEAAFESAAVLTGLGTLQATALGSPAALTFERVAEVFLQEADSIVRRSYTDALSTSHRMRVRISVYDADEVLLGPLEGQVVGGQVDVDSTADIGRTLSLQLADPDLKFQFDPFGPVYADRFVSVSYGVLVDEEESWVDVPIFFGPVSRYSRDGHEVTLEAVGKESLMLPPVPQHIPPAQGTLVQCIREAAQSFGETRFELGNGRGVRNVKLDPSKVGDKKTAWEYLRDFVAAHDFELFYDGRGFLVMRPPHPDTILWTFSDIDTEPAISYDLTETRNRVQVFGRDSDNDVLRATATLAAAHPLSPASLARNGVERYLLEKIKVDHDITIAEAERRASRKLKARSRAALEVSFDSLVVPHLEVGDTVRLSSETFDAEFDLQKFTIPLVAAELMAVGYTKQMQLAQFRQRVRRKIVHHKSDDQKAASA